MMHLIRSRTDRRPGAAVTLAVLLTWMAWHAYMETPWTRDGTVRAYVITETPEVPESSSIYP